MNKLRARLKSGKACVNAWLAIPSGFSAEVMAQCGFDSVTVDMQHGVQDYLSLVQCYQAMDRYPITPMVRVPWNEPGIIGKVLDAGAWGVICPMINTPAEAKALANACLYPPQGRRSNGPIRAAAYGEGTSYQLVANDEVLVIPMIETQEALDNLDAILDVPGISGIYVGPSDLGFSLGLKPMLDREEPKVLSIYEMLIKATSKRGLFAGVHNLTGTYAARMVDMGFRLVTLANDSGLMARAARAEIAATRKAVAAAS
jgi:4-hydroxy-2-oxoheptanedioate aldolase